METKETPPPYSSATDVPSAPQYQDRYHTPQPQPIPVFVPSPYIMSPQQPTAPQSITTNVTVGGAGARSKGSCPVCNGTSWTGSYSCCAWLFCIFCFPIGIICCCCMRKKKCSKCGFTVG